MKSYTIGWLDVINWITITYIRICVGISGQSERKVARDRGRGKWRDQTRANVILASPFICGISFPLALFFLHMLCVLFLYERIGCYTCKLQEFQMHLCCGGVLSKWPLSRGRLQIWWFFKISPIKLWTKWIKWPAVRKANS